MFPEGTPAHADVEIVMNGLTPANIYKFSVKYLTDVGTSPPSVETTSFPISPTSKPQSLAVEEVTSDYIKVTWQPPAVLARGLPLEDLQYKLVIKGINVSLSFKYLNFFIFIRREYEYDL